jgi:hypothetical protein
MRLIDADALIFDLRTSMVPQSTDYTDAVGIAVRWLREAPTISPDSLRPKGRWEIKHRHRGGFRQYTGHDEFGNLHTITVDERFESDDPYCPFCGKFNESEHRNFCPHCGADMRSDLDIIGK